MASGECRDRPGDAGVTATAVDGDGRAASSEPPRAGTQHHVPLLATMLVTAVRRRAWPRAAATTRAWVAAWGAEFLALLALKAHLVRQGRWRIPAEEPLTHTIWPHCS
jgi:hypothetical protein